MEESRLMGAGQEESRPKGAGQEILLLFARAQENKGFV
jgi:hypothetical protein